MCQCEKSGPARGGHSSVLADVQGVLWLPASLPHLRSENKQLFESSGGCAGFFPMQFSGEISTLFKSNLLMRFVYEKRTKMSSATWQLMSQNGVNA